MFFFSADFLLFYSSLSYLALFRNLHKGAHTLCYLWLPPTQGPSFCQKGVKEGHFTTLFRAFPEQWAVWLVITS